MGMNMNGNSFEVPKNTGETPAANDPATTDDSQEAARGNSGGQTPGKTGPVSESPLRAPGLCNSTSPAKERALIRQSKEHGRNPGGGAISSESGSTCSHSTYSEYVENGRMLAEEYCKSLSIRHMEICDMCPIGFAEFILKRKNQVDSITWERYRIQFRVILEHFPHPKNDLAISIVEERCDHPLARHHPELPDTSGESASKGTKSKKGIPKKDFDAILAQLEKMEDHRLNDIVIAWMKAGLATGLRPIEWQTANIETFEDPGSPTGRRILLKVLNAKSTNDRADGVTRTLDISNFQPDTLEAIGRMAEFGAAELERGTFKFNYSHCANVLSRACRKLFDRNRTGTGKSYTIYQLRHQFIANMKSLKSIEDVAALAGHISLKTSRRNYAGKKDAWPFKDIHDIAELQKTPATPRHQPGKTENTHEFNSMLDELADMSGNLTFT